MRYRSLTIGPGSSSVTVLAMTSNMSRPKDAMRAKYSEKKSRPMKGTRGILACAQGGDGLDLAIHRDLVGRRRRECLGGSARECLAGVVVSARIEEASKAWLKHGWEQARCLPAFYPNTCTARHCHVKVDARLLDRPAGSGAERDPDSRIDGQSAIDHLIID